MKRIGLLLVAVLLGCGGFSQRVGRAGNPHGGPPPLMGRQKTTGFEADTSFADGQVDGQGALGNVLVTSDTTVFRSGARSAKCSSGAGNGTSYLSLSYPGNFAGTNNFLRNYIRMSALPTSKFTLFTTDQLLAVGFRVDMTTTGTLQL